MDSGLRRNDKPNCSMSPSPNRCAYRAKIPVRIRRTSTSMFHVAAVRASMASALSMRVAREDAGCACADSTGCSRE